MNTIESNQSVVDIDPNRTQLVGVEEVAKKVAEDIASMTVREQVDKVKSEILIAIGVFAAFMTFVVGELSILKDVKDINDKIGFSFIFAAIMIGFQYGLVFIFQEKINDGKFHKMAQLALILFGIGLVFIGLLVNI